MLNWKIKMLEKAIRLEKSIRPCSLNVGLRIINIKLRKFSIIKSKNYLTNSI